MTVEPLRLEQCKRRGHVFSSVVQASLKDMYDEGRPSGKYEAVQNLKVSPMRPLSCASTCHLGSTCRGTGHRCNKTSTNSRMGDILSKAAPSVLTLHLGNFFTPYDTVDLKMSLGIGGNKIAKQLYDYGRWVDGSCIGERVVLAAEREGFVTRVEVTFEWALAVC